jgi:hypothetical protein
MVFDTLFSLEVLRRKVSQIENSFNKYEDSKLYSGKKNAWLVSVERTWISKW